MRKAAAVTRDGNAGRPVPLPEGERCYLYVTEAEIQQLAEGIVPEVVRTQAKVALMSTADWVAWIRTKDDEEKKSYTRRSTMDDATSSRTASTD